MRRKISYDPKRDYYDILGINTTASIDEIRLAYRRTVRQVHPDLHPDQADWATEQIQLINEAYGVLRNPAQRREYDGQRWPHLRSRPETERSAYRSPFTAPDYNSDRPWWEQVERHAPHRYPFADNIPASPPDAVPLRPAWLVVSGWLNRHHLGLVQPTWLTLVGIWRSPYGGLLSVLSVLLALNVAALIYVAITPQDFDNLLQLPAKTATFYQNPASPDAARDQLHPECSDPRVQITSPVKNQFVGDTFSITGTVQHPGLSYYLIQMGYMETSTSVPTRWRTVRARPENQSLSEETIQDGLLAEDITMQGRMSGYYAVRLRLMLQDQTELPPCDVVVRH